MAQIGDTVRFLNSIGGGTIVRITDNIAHVADEDGFETPVLIRELVVVKPASAGKPADRGEGHAETTAVPPTRPQSPKVKPEETETTEETPGGEKLNIVLAYEPDDIKQLNTTTFSTYLVNDSNYYLYFSYMSRSDRDSMWTTRYAGIVEPNIQVFVGELLREDITEIGEIAVQCIAFKRDKAFKMKNPVAVEQKLDTTKFFKLHCFRENIYFDTKVIAVDIVRDDVVTRKAAIDSSRLETAMKEKMKADKPVRKRVVKHSEKRNKDIIEVDLHIQELVDNVHGLSNADMLNLQVDEFRRVMDSNLKNHGQKIVFIHGKGEGVLRQALLKELNYRYKGFQFQDASFREYGYGATQVTIK